MLCARAQIFAKSLRLIGTHNAWSRNYRLGKTARRESYAEGQSAHASHVLSAHRGPPSVIHPIVRLDTRFILWLRLIGQQDGYLGATKAGRGCAVQDETSALHLR